MLKLFVLETCPYCHKVMDFLEENKIKYEKIDIENKASEDSLIRIGGKRQVPFLFDKNSGLKMYESADIIEYLSTLL